MNRFPANIPRQTFFDEILVAASPEGFIVELAQDLGWRPDEGSIRHDPADRGTGTYLTVYAGSHSPLSFGVVKPSDLDPFFEVNGVGIDVPAPVLVSSLASSGPPPARHLLLTDGDRAVLLDASSQEPLLSAETADRFDWTIKPLLVRDRVLGGSLRELRRKTFTTFAKELREWSTDWENTLVEKIGMDRAASHRLLDSMIIARAGIDSQMFRSVANGKLYRLAVDGLFADRQSSGVKWRELLCSLRTELGLALLDIDETADRLFAADGLGTDLCRSLMEQSRSKFTVPVVLESFNYGDPSEKSLVRMRPELDEDIEIYLSRQTVETIPDINVTVDLNELGYRGVLNVFDRLLRFYTELEESLGLLTPTSSDEVGLSHADSTDPVESRRQAFRDIPQFVVRHNFVARVNTAHQHRVVTLLLYLHVLYHHERSQRAFKRFPPAESCVLIIDAADRRAQSIGRNISCLA
ncbi:MAG: hypothetical protein J7M12_03880 [Candidatus Hydrogenedentes bacterium]|nr:hypothetical protein [Candidatus Hydrogenedentota bacterium]